MIRSSSSDSSHFWKSSRFWLPVILAGAALSRLTYLLELRRTPFYENLLLDLSSYDAWARKIAAGDWLGSRVFYQDPLYPYFLGSIYAFFGHRLTLVYAIQLMIGVVTCYLLYQVGAQLFSKEAGLLAAVLGALYKPFIFYDIQIEKSFLAVFLVSASCYLLIRSVERDKGLLPLFGAGISLGMAILIRGNYLFLLPLFVAGIWLLTPLQQKGRAAVCYALGACLVLGSTLVRNRVAGGEWVLTTAQAGQNFYIGNNANNRTGMYRVPEFARADPRFEESDFALEAERIAGRSLSPGEVSSFWMKRAWNFIFANPGLFVRALARKSALFWNNYEIPDNLDQYYFERYSRIMRAWLPAFGFVAPFGILGMFLYRREWRRLWPVYLFALGYFASVILFYVFSRYRLPIVPFLIVFAAGALVRLANLCRERKAVELGAAGILLLVSGIGVNLSLGDSYNPAAINNLGAVLLQMQDISGAESLFRQVIERTPDYADARGNLAIALMRQGDTGGAIAELEEFIRLKPNHPGGYTNLGSAFAMQGADAKAEEMYRRALQLDPRSLQAWQGIGDIKRRRSDFQGALEACREAARIDPASPEALNSLAVVLVAMGSYREALNELRTAVGLNPRYDRALFNMGVCLEKLGQTDQALESYRKAVEANPRYAEAYNNMANLLAEKGDRAGAIEAYQRFLAVWTGSAGVRSSIEAEILRLKNR